MSNTLSFGKSAIRELDGLFSLNDLHRASGGADKHAPKRFLRNEQTQALVREIQGPDMALALKVTHGGSNPGTYACRELVVAYAAWISATFHLKVLRVFLSHNEDHSERLEAALAVAAEVAGKASLAVYKAIMTSGAQHWRHARWVVALGDEIDGRRTRPWARLVEDNELVMSLGHLAEALHDPEDSIGSSKELADLADACHRELIRRQP